MQNLARIQLTFPAPRAEVYAAWIDADALTRWFCEFAAVDTAGRAYDFWGRFTPGAPRDRSAGHHPITQLAEKRHLAYTWPVNGSTTQVLVKLRTRDNATLLTLRHSAATQPAQAWHWRDYWFLHLENLRAHLAGKPALARVDFSRPMVGDIEHELLIDASPATVFATIIRPDQIDRWIGNGAAVDTQRGHYSFGWMGMKILEIVPDAKLAVSPTQDNNGVEEITPHVFTWTLAESHGKTRLTFVHSGFAPDEANDSAYLGWLSYMVRLKAAAEFGAAWQHPLVPVEPELAFMYPVEVVQRQTDLVDDLLAPADPLLT